MELLNSLKLYLPVEKEIEKIIRFENGYVDEAQEDLDKLKKELSLKSKKQITRQEEKKLESCKSSLHHHSQLIINFKKLLSLFSELKSMDMDMYEFPENIKSAFDKLGTLLPNEEIDKISVRARDCLKNANDDKKEQAKEKVADVRDFLKKLKIDRYLEHIHFNTPGFISFYTSLDQFDILVLSKYSTSSFYIDYKPAEVNIGTFDEIFLSEVERMIQSNKLEKNKSTKDIINNFWSIKEAYKNKAKLSEITSTLSSLIAGLKRQLNVDTSDICKILTSLQKKYSKQFIKVNAYLSKFDFDSLKKQVKVINEKEEQESLKQQKLTEYEQLAYELEQAESINPHDRKKIEKILEEMRNVSMSFSHNDYELDRAMTNGRSKYRDEIRDKKILAAAIKMQKIKEEQRDAEIRERIYYNILSELEAEGALKEDFEFRNGDVYGIPIDIQALIKRKIAESKKANHMLEEQQQSVVSGVVSPDTKRVANEAYGEYFKYRAFLKDKKHCKTFREYVQEFYPDLNITEDMVDDELKATGGFRR